MVLGRQVAWQRSRVSRRLRWSRHRCSRGWALLGSGAEYQMSVVVAANTALHAAVLEEIDAGIERLKRSPGRPPM